jgi:hypothetical protein
MRYAKHRIAHATRNPAAELARVCEEQDKPVAIEDPVEAAMNS